MQTTRTLIDRDDHADNMPAFETYSGIYSTIILDGQIVVLFLNWDGEIVAATVATSKYAASELAWFAQ